MLGVLGGMGPMATVDFMRKLVANTRAARDQDHLDTMVCSAAHIPDRVAAIRGTGPDPLPAMIAVLRRLEGAGATHIAIPCNTAHYWYPALQAATYVPILHIVDAVGNALARDGVRGGPIGLLATDGTLQMALYQDRLAARGFQCRAPAEQDAVMRAIGLVKAGAVLEASIILRKAAQALLADGCRRVVLACTEVPIALEGGNDDLRPWLLDATDALARACVAACGLSLQAPALAA